MFKIVYNGIPKHYKKKPRINVGLYTFATNNIKQKAYET